MNSLFLWSQSILVVHLSPSERNSIGDAVWRWRHFQIRSIFSYCLNLFLFCYFLTSATATSLKRKKQNQNKNNPKHQKVTASTFVYMCDRNNKNTQVAHIKQCGQNELHTLLCCDRHNSKKMVFFVHKLQFQRFPILH